MTAEPTETTPGTLKAGVICKFLSMETIAMSFVFI